MDQTVNGILFFMAVSSIFLIEFGWGLKFTISPAVASTIVPTDISLSCELDDTEKKHVYSWPEYFTNIRSMSIAQNGAKYEQWIQWIAQVRVNEQAVTLDSGVQALGHVQEDGRNMFLHVNITGMKFDQAVNMSCYVHVEEEQLLYSAMQAIAVKNDIDYALELGYTQARTILEETKRFINNQKLKLDWFIQENSVNVYFRGTMDFRDTYSQGKIMRFRWLPIMEQDGYDYTTGKFTAPYPGYYIFEIGWHVNVDSWQYVDIRTDSRVLTRIGGMADDWRTYAEGGVVAKLDKGEEVYPYVSETEDTCEVQRRDTSGAINHFYGYLIKPL